MITVADAAPTGAGLAIVGVILLALFALFVGIVVLVVVKVRRAVRRRREADATPPESRAAG